MAEPDLWLPPLAGELGRAVSRIIQDGGALASASNPGLVFERYPRCWEISPRGWDLGPRRRDFLTRFVRDFARLGPVYQPLLDSRVAVLSRAVDTFRDAVGRWRFVTGVGTDHPIENGFAFHRLLGVPFLAGSSVKGLVRAAAGVAGADEEEVLRLFGRAEAGEEEEAKDSRGQLVFLDALPLNWPRLGVDVINNHRPTWTAMLNGATGGGGPGPAELASAAGLEDPVPVFFLVVEPGSTWRFWVLPRPFSNFEPGTMERVWGWLELGLQFLGIGAKTAVGYGRFAPPPSAGVTAGTVPGESAPRRAGATGGRAAPWESRVRGIGWGEAEIQVPKLLDELTGDERRRAALELVKNLGNKKLRQRQVVDWVLELLRAAGLE